MAKLVAGRRRQSEPFDSRTFIDSTCRVTVGEGAGGWGGSTAGDIEDGAFKLFKCTFPGFNL